MLMLDILCITLSVISNSISIITPIVLLLWFYYSQKLNLSKAYYEEINGIYAGRTSRVFGCRLWLGFVTGDENASSKTPHGAYSFPL